MLDLLALTEVCAARWLTREPKQGMKVLTALKTCRDNGVYNPGVGHLLGWLATELFR